jgi:hypothetical protein
VSQLSPREALTGNHGYQGLEGFMGFMKGMIKLKANVSSASWSKFDGKYVIYPKFRSKVWAFRETYHKQTKAKLEEKKSSVTAIWLHEVLTSK